MRQIFRHRDRYITVELNRTDPDRFHALVDGNALDVQAQLVGADKLHAVINGVGHLIHVVKVAAGYHVAVDGHVFVLTPEAQGATERHAATLANPQIVAPMPGKVLQVLVKEGQEVAEGDGLVILEAMKMENRIVAEAPAIVKKVNVTEGQMVEDGLVMIELEYRT